MSEYIEFETRFVDLDKVKDYRFLI